jgi:hypothetical protein
MPAMIGATSAPAIPLTAYADAVTVNVGSTKSQPPPP